MPDALQQRRFALNGTDPSRSWRGLRRGREAGGRRGGQGEKRGGHRAFWGGGGWGWGMRRESEGEEGGRERVAGPQSWRNVGNAAQKRHCILLETSWEEIRHAQLPKHTPATHEVRIYNHRVQSLQTGNSSCNIRQQSTD